MLGAGDNGPVRSEGSALYLVLPLVLLGATLVGVPTMILSGEGWPRYQRLSHEVNVIREQNERLRREVEALSRQAKVLRRDPREVGRIARDELGYLRRGEVVYQFPSQE